MPGEFIVEGAGVAHRYWRRQSLDHISFRFSPGVTGLLGPNGAGKTTLMKLLATAMPLQQGSITVGGIALSRKNVPQVRAGIGYLPQRFEVMGWSSIRRNVEYAAWAQGLDGDPLEQSVDVVLRAVDLQDRARSRARTLSGGMRQRLGLACALVHRPRFLILDEPTVGLDPSQRRALRETIRSTAKDSVVLLSTHLVEDLADLATSVVVLHEGVIKFNDTLSRLRALGSARMPEAPSVLEGGYYAALEATSVIQPEPA